MRTTFLIDKFDSTTISWNDLIRDIGEAKEYNPLCFTPNYYTIFKTFIISMLIGEEIILLDSDLSNSEATSFAEISCSSKNSIDLSDKTLKNIDNPESLVRQLRATSPEWLVTIFTSGTTGKPKKVTHAFDTIARNVNISDELSNATWGFAYNPTHMAGIQVFLQALLNGNTIVRLFGLEPYSIADLIKGTGITHISATPTFYRQLETTNNAFPLITRVTSGGENLNRNMLTRLSRMFPNAQIRNIYALTEAGTLFTSDNDMFTVKEKYSSYVKVTNNELYIHKQLLGKSIAQSYTWYSTGDIVEIVNDEPLRIRFLSRKSDFINVGGYKVNPSEVEDALLQIPGILDAMIFSKPSSVIGNIICCKIIRSDTSITENAIRSFLSKSLQEYKIPRIIQFVDKLELGRTGKSKRSL